jgi:peptidoglycan/LPS O-acetylase OafA/YrhL
MTLRSPRLVHLDMMRGLAALAVVIGHIRGFLLVDYGELPSRGLPNTALYFVTGLAHHAVIAFFALSGFLVGGKVLKEMLSGSWSWEQYVVARLVRLWTVIIPALGLTLLMDLVGRALGGGLGYNGIYYPLLSSGPIPSAPADYSFSTLLANVLFLQTIVAPTYGSNGPLWSLANEFWYYVVFPLAAAAVIVRSPVWQRLGAAVFAAALALSLPTQMMVLGLIWVGGALAHYLMTLKEPRPGFSSPIYLIGAGALAASVCYDAMGWSHDLLLGSAWALLLPGLVALPHVGGIYARVATGLSEISYTLYATHFPLLALIWFTAIAPMQWTPGFTSLAVGLGALALTLAYATVIWWCFERNTLRVRATAMRWIQLRRVETDDKVEMPS